MRKKPPPGTLVVVNAKLLGSAFLGGTGGKRIINGDIGVVVGHQPFNDGYTGILRVAFGSGEATGATGDVWEGYLREVS